MFTHALSSRLVGRSALAASLALGLIAFAMADETPKDAKPKVSTVKVGKSEAKYQDISGTYLKKFPPFDPNAKITKVDNYRQIYVIFEGKDAQGNDISNEVQRVILVGKPAHLEEIGNDGDLVISNADQIDYNADTNVAVLDGNVSVVRQGRSEFHGEHMVYNTETGEMESGNLNGSAPVHIIIQPKPKPAAKPAGEAQKADVPEKDAPKKTDGGA